MLGRARWSWIIPLALAPLAGGTEPRPDRDPEAGAAECVKVPEPTPEAIRYYRTGNALWVVRELWGLAVPAALLESGLSARLRRAAWRLGRRWFGAVAVYAVLFLVLTALIDWPLAYYSSFVRPHAYGLSNQPVGRWWHHWAVGLGTDLVLWAALLWVPYGLMRRSPRRWWLMTGLAVIPLMVVMAFLRPIVLDPLYNRFCPMHDQALEAKIRALAERAGIAGGRIYEVDKSRDTKAVNAYVAGLFGSKRIVLWDTLLAKLADDQVLVVMGHEMGHYVLGHVVRGLAVAAALTLVGLYGVHRAAGWLIRRYGGRWGVEGMADVASLPLLLALGQFAALVLVPIGYAYSRHLEFEADRFALELTRLNRPGATAFVTLQRANLSHPRPGPLYRIWRATHPSLSERIAFFNEYRPWQTGAPVVYGARFRSDRPGAGGPPLDVWRTQLHNNVKSGGIRRPVTVAPEVPR